MILKNPKALTIALNLIAASTTKIRNKKRVLNLEKIFNNCPINKHAL